MKKILMVSDAWAPQHNGVTTVLAELTTRLLKRGYEVSVIHPELFPNVPLPIYPEIHIALFPRRRMRALLDDFKPDAVHLMTEGPLGWAARAVCLERGIPFTSWYHTNFQLYADVRLRGFLRPIDHLLRRFHRAAVRTVVTTPSLQKELESNGYRNVVVAPLGVDVDFFKRTDEAPALPFPAPIFVYFGRLAVEKSPEEFLKLELPGSKVVLGAEPRGVFEELQKKYPDVHFMGAYDAKTQEFVDLLSACDVFVFPSRTETFGLVVLEALACGIPVAAYPVMGPRDTITHGTDGYLSEDLREAAIKCLTLSRDACRAKALIYSWDASVDGFITSLAPIHTA